MPTRVLPSSSNPYGGGSVIFDSSPYTNYYLQQQAKEQAKEEALDNYFKSLDKNINPAGMRSQDVGDLIKQQNEDRLFYLQNKDKIKNPSLDGGTAYNEYMGRNQSKLAYINESKGEAEKYKTIAPIFADPTKRSLIGDDTLGQLDLHDLPLRDPRRKSFDVTKMNFNPKPFDTLSFTSKVGTGLKSIDEAPIITTDPKTFTKTVTTNQTLSPDSIMSLAQRGAAEYVSDPSFKVFVNNLHKDEKQFNQLNKLYKNYFNKDIESEAELAGAYALSAVPISSSKKAVSNDALAMANLNDKLIRSRPYKGPNFIGAGGQQQMGNSLDDIGGVTPLPLLNSKGERTGTITKGYVYNKDGSPRSGKTTLDRKFLPLSITNSLKASGINTDDIPEYITVYSDNGQITGLQGDGIGIIDRQAMQNAQLKFNTEPQKGRQMQFGNTKPITPPKGKPISGLKWK